MNTERGPLTKEKIRY